MLRTGNEMMFAILWSMTAMPSRLLVLFSIFSPTAPRYEWCRVTTVHCRSISLMLATWQSIIHKLNMRCHFGFSQWADSPGPPSLKVRHPHGPTALTAISAPVNSRRIRRLNFSRHAITVIYWKGRKKHSGTSRKIRAPRGRLSSRARDALWNCAHEIFNACVPFHDY